MGFEACCGLVDLMDVGDRRMELRDLPVLTTITLHSNAMKNIKEVRLAGLEAVTSVTVKEGVLAGMKQLKKREGNYN